MLYNAVMEINSEQSLENAEDSIDLIAAGIEAAVLVAVVAGLTEITTDTSFGQIAINGFALEDKVKNVIKSKREKFKRQTEKMFMNMAKANDKWAEPYFKHQNIAQAEFKDNQATKKIIAEHLDDAIADIDYMTNVKVMGVVQNGKLVSLRDAYITAATDAAASLRAGEDAFKASVNRTVKQLASSGIRIPDNPTLNDIPRIMYLSGRTRNLRSSLSMNVFDDYTQCMQEYRMELGKEFKADGVIISAHALCAQDHIDIQGNKYRNEEWNKINNGLNRAIGTLNCKHQADPCIYDLVQSPYSENDLAQLKRNSEEKISFTGIGGKTLTKSRYDASQYLRGLETNVRDQKTLAAMQKAAGVSSADATKRARALTKQYNEICDETGLKPRPNRMRSML